MDTSAINNLIVVKIALPDSTVYDIRSLAILMTEIVFLAEVDTSILIFLLF